MEAPSIWFLKGPQFLLVLNGSVCSTTAADVPRGRRAHVASHMTLATALNRLRGDHSHPPLWTSGFWGCPVLLIPAQPKTARPTKANVSIWISNNSDELQEIPIRYQSNLLSLIRFLDLEARHILVLSWFSGDFGLITELGDEPSNR